MIADLDVVGAAPFFFLVIALAATWVIELIVRRKRRR